MKLSGQIWFCKSCNLGVLCLNTSQFYACCYKHLICAFWLTYTQAVCRCKGPRTDTLFTRKGTAPIIEFFAPQAQYFLVGATYSKSLI